MRKIVLPVVLLSALYASAGFTAESAGGNKAQTTRMSQCSTEAKEKGLKGDARKDHMSQCLRGSGTQAAAKECTAQATEKGLKGTRHKEFVSDCIKTRSTGANVGQGAAGSEAGA
ncbi:MAG: phosphate starvation-inducible protein PsiF [Burkholderiales bacterium]|nr:phosphate starvation-inducible protein PsiF [Burkholderiales bacterium]